MPSYIYRGDAHAEVFDDHGNMKSCLFTLSEDGAHVIGRAKHLDAICNRSKIEAEITEEREAQDRKWGVQNHSPHKWLTILGEEFGEACKAALEHDTAGYRKELIQVAAVAVAMIEQLDREGHAV